jgi:hypothetical protein
MANRPFFLEGLRRFASRPDTHGFVMPPVSVLVRVYLLPLRCLQKALATCSLLVGYSFQWHRSISKQPWVDYRFRLYSIRVLYGLKKDRDNDSHINNFSVAEKLEWISFRRP